MPSSVQSREQRSLSQTCCKDLAILAQCDAPTGIDWLNDATGLEGSLDFCPERHARLVEDRMFMSLHVNLELFLVGARRNIPPQHVRVKRELPRLDSFREPFVSIQQPDTQSQRNDVGAPEQVSIQRLTRGYREVLLGITGKDFCIVAASKAAMRGATILKASDDKTRQLSKHVLMAYSGEAGDTGELLESIFHCLRT